MNPHYTPLLGTEWPDYCPPWEFLATPAQKLTLSPRLQCSPWTPILAHLPLEVGLASQALSGPSHSWPHPHLPLQGLLRSARGCRRQELLQRSLSPQEWPGQEKQCVA